MQNANNQKQTQSFKAEDISREELLQVVSASSDAQRILQLLQEKGGHALQDAAQAAMKGNPTEFQKILQDVTNTSEGAAAANNLRKTFGK